MAGDDPMTGVNPPRLPGDWVRVATLAIGFVGLGWILVTRYTGPGRLEPHLRLIRDYFRAAAAHDSLRLRGLVSSDQPLRWALDPGNAWLLPDPDSSVEIRSSNRSGSAEEVAVWVRGPCTGDPYFVIVAREGRNRRIEAVRTKCTGSGRH